jgi:hypothetical protein
VSCSVQSSGLGAHTQFVSPLRPAARSGEQEIHGADGGVHFHYTNPSIQVLQETGKNLAGNFEDFTPVFIAF